MAMEEINNMSFLFYDYDYGKWLLLTNICGAIKCTTTIQNPQRTILRFIYLTKCWAMKVCFLAYLLGSFVAFIARSFHFPYKITRRIVIVVYISAVHFNYLYKFHVCVCVCECIQNKQMSFTLVLRTCSLFHIWWFTALIQIQLYISFTSVQFSTINYRMLFTSVSIVHIDVDRFISNNFFFIAKCQCFSTSIFERKKRKMWKERWKKNRWRENGQI